MIYGRPRTTCGFLPLHSRQSKLQFPDLLLVAAESLSCVGYPLHAQPPDKLINSYIFFFCYRILQKKNLKRNNDYRWWVH